MAGEVQLRPVVTGDIALFFEHHLEVRPLPADAPPSDRDARQATFLQRWQQMLAEETVLARTIEWKGAVSGYVMRSVQREKPAISCWLGRSYWGKGIGTKAVLDFLGLVEERPLYAIVPYDNLASLKILRKTGFQIIGHDSCFSEAHGYEIDEIILALA